MNNIILVGLPGVGKSVTAVYLAKMLEKKYYDLDNHIESKFNLSISDIFIKLGESKFRQYEYTCLCDVLKFDSVIIATGGGVVTYPDSYDLLKDSNDTLIYLHASIAYLTNRYIQNPTLLNSRPLINNTNIEKFIDNLYRIRNDRYNNLAKYVLNVDNLALDDICQTIVNMIEIKKA